MSINLKVKYNLLNLIAISIILIAIGIPGVYAAEQTKVIIPNVSVESGANVTVPILINTSSLVSGTSIKLWFDPAVVNVTKITKGDFPGTFTPNTFSTSSGWVKVVVDVGANAELTGDDITVAYFTLKAVGTPGMSSYLNLEVQSLLNDSFNPTPFTPINATFSIPASTNVVIPSVSIESGANTTVPILINTSSLVSGTSIKLWFDPAVVNVTKITKGDFPGTFTPNTFSTSSGWVKVVVDVGANAELTGDNITVAYFTLKAVGTPGMSSYLNLEVKSLLNDSFNPIPFTPINGTFAIQESVIMPELTTYSISNTTIIPPQITSIDVGFSERVRARITIEDQDRNLVKQLYYSSGVTNPSPKTWDGTYTNDTQVPDGSYYVNVTGESTTTGLSVVNNSEIIIVESPTGTVTLVSIAVTGNATVVNGSTATYTATATYSDNSTAVITAAWTSSNETVATINASTGVLTALTAGTTNVTASRDGVDGTLDVTVTATPVLTTISVTPAIVTVAIGGTRTFAATTLDQFEDDITATVVWTSSNTTVATIDGITGELTAIAEGTTTVTATNGSVNGTATVNVVPLVVESIIITGFTIDHGNLQGMWMNASVNITNNDTTSHWLVIDVSGTHSVDGYPLVATATVNLDAGESLNNIPVLITVPPSASTGIYAMGAMIWKLDEFPTPDKLLNTRGPQIITIYEV